MQQNSCYPGTRPKTPLPLYGGGAGGGGEKRHLRIFNYLLGITENTEKIVYTEFCVGWFKKAALVRLRAGKLIIEID